MKLSSVNNNAIQIFRLIIYLFYTDNIQRRDTSRYPQHITNVYVSFKVDANIVWTRPVSNKCMPINELIQYRLIKINLQLSPTQTKNLFEFLYSWNTTSSLNI